MSSRPSRQQIKDEIDGIPRQHLAVLHRIVLALDNGNGAQASDAKSLAWGRFIDETYGCLAEAPIDRGESVDYESREELV